VLTIFSDEYFMKEAYKQALYAKEEGNKYLKDCTLFVTVEPCVMCAGASYWAQLKRVVFATPDAKRGFRRFGNPMLHPKTELETGVLAHECASLMSEFFLNKRI
jgi:tRNA(adenine34) deaminase